MSSREWTGSCERGEDGELSDGCKELHCVDLRFGLGGRSCFVENSKRLLVGSGGGCPVVAVVVFDIRPSSWEDAALISFSSLLGCLHCFDADVYMEEAEGPYL